MPAGFVVDRTRVELGRGESAFARARHALEQWSQFRLGWLDVFPEAAPLRADETVVVIAQVNGLWCSNAARIIYVVNDTDRRLGPQRFGFAYGTLPDHVEAGEERFLVEWDLATDQVCFDVLAFSRPRHLLARLFRRQARAMQKQFAADAAAAMQRAVAPL